MKFVLGSFMGWRIRKAMVLKEINESRIPFLLVNSECEENFGISYAWIILTGTGSPQKETSLGTWMLGCSVGWGSGAMPSSKVVCPFATKENLSLKFLFAPQIFYPHYGPAWMMATQHPYEFFVFINRSLITQITSQSIHLTQLPHIN